MTVHEEIYLKMHGYAVEAKERKRFRGVDKMIGR